MTADLVHRSGDYLQSIQSCKKQVPQIVSSLDIPSKNYLAFRQILSCIFAIAKGQAMYDLLCEISDDQQLLYITSSKSQKPNMITRFLNGS